METMNWAAHSGMPATIMSSVSPSGWVLHFRIFRAALHNVHCPSGEVAWMLSNNWIQLGSDPRWAEEVRPLPLHWVGEDGMRVDSNMEILVRTRRGLAKDTCPCFIEQALSRGWKGLGDWVGVCMQNI